MNGISAEVFVVDNSSVDGSVQMVRDKFPWVQVIANAENVGFSRANNQAMRIAQGEYVLLLNPDTVIEEDTLRKVIGFMDEHPDAGGLGVDMVDGKGRFLPESKRGLPTPATSFYKIFGVSRLFPKSPRFNRYHLGHLDRHSTHEIEILSGAFMLMRKKALDQVGLLDEAFFMYGEDIDLSWRIIQGGWKNYYFPGTRIIHYKGESTKKGSLNYVFVFYNAMVIFARKHFSEKNARLFSFFIHAAIYLRAGVAIAARFVKAAALPLADVALTLAGWWWIKDLYAHWQQKVYASELLWPVFLITTLVYAFVAWINGGYDKPVVPSRILRPIATGVLAIVVMYSLLPEDLRFSRALILGGGALAMSVFYINRWFLQRVQGKSTLAKRFGVAGSPEEFMRVRHLIESTQFQPSFIGHIAIDDKVVPASLGHLRQLDEILRVHALDQVVFCAQDISSAGIIAAMSDLSATDVEFKIAQPETLFIIGSNSIDTSGDVYMLDVNSLSKPVNRRRKRVFDVAASLMILLLSPVLMWAQELPLRLIPNALSVLLGRKTWIGYNAQADASGLPKLAPAVVSISSADARTVQHSENAAKLNVLYAKDYKLSNDAKLLSRAWRKLG